MLQFQTQSIRPLTTAHLAQTMTLLGMTSAELSQKIDVELAKNPALELVEERRCPTCRRILTAPGPCPICSRPHQADAEQPIVFVSSPSDHFYQSSSGSSGTPEELPDDNIAPTEELPSFVLRQIASELHPDDRMIAAHILTSLDDDGLRQATVFEISRYHHVPISRVEAVVNLIQRAEPIGVGSASTQEALLIQLEVLSENQDVPEFAELAIQEGMKLLSRHQYSELANLLGTTSQKAREIAHFIGANLNPYPGRAHWGDIRQGNNAHPQVYHHPDIIITRLDSQPNSPLVVEIIAPLRGTLRINPLFRKGAKEAPTEMIDKWKKDLESAGLLIKCIQQRNNTMQRLMTYLTTHQRNFILRGDKHLRPTTRVRTANELGVHESTVSRAVSGKCLQLPNGYIIPLKRFFDRSLHIRARIIEIIKSEKRTLTDSQLATLLSQKGYPIARRTVAKYRSMEGILPAHMRKNLAA